jgi:sialic acid synthase SpsE
LKRPGTGMSPAQLKLILGKTTRVKIASGALIAPDMFE